MDVLNYLEDNNAQIARHLTETAQNYWLWTRDYVFEEVKKEFESIKVHFSKETLLISTLKHSERVKSLLEITAKKKADIKSDIDQIVEIHIDELEFEHALKSIANKYGQYANYCASTLYPALRKQMTTDDLNRVSEQLWQKVSANAYTPV